MPRKICIGPPGFQRKCLFNVKFTIVIVWVPKYFPANGDEGLSNSKKVAPRCSTTCILTPTIYSYEIDFTANDLERVWILSS